MRLMHLSDLHLGRRLYQHAFLPQQERSLRQLVQLASEQQIDGVLISGDIYDKPVPPAEAVTLFDRFLTALADMGIAVFFISGNHDSPERLQYGSHLLQSRRIHIGGVFTGQLCHEVLEDDFGEVHVYMMPYARFAAAAQYLPELQPADYTELLRAVFAAADIDPAKRNVLLYHGFVLGGQLPPEESDSELQLGGVQLTDAAVLDCFDYTALGHIHKPQWVKKNRIRYSGSLLKYSFSEAEQQKSVSIVELGKKGDIQVTAYPLKPEQDMRRLRGTLEQLLAHADPTEDLIRVELTDSTLQPYALEKLRVYYPNVLEMVYLFREQQGEDNVKAAAIAQKSVSELLTAFFDDVYHYHLTPEEQALLTELCQEAEGQR